MHDDRTVRDVRCCSKAFSKQTLSVGSNYYPLVEEEGAYISKNSRTCGKSIGLFESPFFLSFIYISVENVRFHSEYCCFYFGFDHLEAN